MEEKWFIIMQQNSFEMNIVKNQLMPNRKETQVRITSLLPGHMMKVWPHV